MRKFFPKGLVVNYDNVKLICTGLDICFIIIHSLLIALFRYHQVRPMFIFNIGSVILYCFLPILLHWNHFSLFVQLMNIEVVVHMTLAVYFVGWDSGFQIAIMGFNVFLVWAEFLATSLNLEKVRSLALCLVSMIAYAGAAVLDHNHIPRYLMPADSAYRLKLAWIITVFLITIFFLQLFAHLASGMQKQLAEVALRDKLTGLHNRYYMNDYLEQAAKKSCSWLAIADVDDFKSVNDLYGHNCGDYVLKTVAEIAEKLDAEVCRWGGEEFLFVGENELALKWMDRFRRQIEEYDFKYEGQTIHLTITVGIAYCEKDESVEAWVNQADKKLYEGKTTGKNKVVI